MALTEPFYCTLFCGSPMPTLLQVHPPQIVPFWLCPLFPIRTLTSHHSLSPNKHLFLSSCPLILLLPHPTPRSLILLAVTYTISLPDCLKQILPILPGPGPSHPPPQSEWCSGSTVGCVGAGRLFHQCLPYRSSRGGGGAPEDIDFRINPWRRRLFTTSYLQTRDSVYSTI